MNSLDKDEGDWSFVLDDSKSVAKSFKEQINWDILVNDIFNPVIKHQAKIILEKLNIKEYNVNLKKLLTISKLLSYDDEGSSLSEERFDRVFTMLINEFYKG